MNKVGPYRNPQETYKCKRLIDTSIRNSFAVGFNFFFFFWKDYKLPYCQPEEEIETHAEGLGEALQGYELLASPMKIQYTRKRTNSEKKKNHFFCQVMLNRNRFARKR